MADRGRAGRIEAVGADANRCGPDFTIPQCWAGRSRKVSCSRAEAGWGREVSCGGGVKEEGSELQQGSGL